MRRTSDHDYVYTPSSDETRAKQSASQRARLGIPPGFRMVNGVCVAEEDVEKARAYFYPCQDCGEARSPTAKRCISCSRHRDQPRRAASIALTSSTPTAPRIIYHSAREVPIGSDWMPAPGRYSCLLAPKRVVRHHRDNPNFIVVATVRDGILTTTSAQVFHWRYLQERYVERVM